MGGEELVDLLIEVERLRMGLENAEATFLNLIAGDGTAVDRQLCKAAKRARCILNCEKLPSELV